MTKTSKKSLEERESQLSIHTYEELAALHAIAQILAQPGDLHHQLALILKDRKSVV